MANAPINQFRSSMGMRLTDGLFYERTSNPETALYTLKREDTKGYKSLYRLFLESTLSDPSEYSFATKYLDGWEHWEILCTCPWFQEYRDAWRREVEVRTRSLALKKVLSVAEGEGRDAFQASKYLLDGHWVDKPAKRGRKTKEAVQAEIKRLAIEERTVDDDYERVIN